MLDGHIHCYWSGLPVANITTHAGIHAANNDNGLVWGKGGNVRLAVMPDGHAKLPQGIEERRVVRDHNKQQAKRYGARFLDRAGIEPAAPAPVKAAAPVKAPAPAPATGGAVPEDAADWIKASPALSARFTAIMADLATVAIPHSAKVTAAAVHEGSTTVRLVSSSKVKLSSRSTMPVIRSSYWSVGNCGTVRAVSMR